MRRQVNHAPAHGAVSRWVVTYCLPHSLERNPSKGDQEGCYARGRFDEDFFTTAAFAGFSEIPFVGANSDTGAGQGAFGAGDDGILVGFGYPREGAKYPSALRCVHATRAESRVSHYGGSVFAGLELEFPQNPFAPEIDGTCAPRRSSAVAAQWRVRSRSRSFIAAGARSTGPSRAISPTMDGRAKMASFQADVRPRRAPARISRLDAPWMSRRRSKRMSAGGTGPVGLSPSVPPD